MELQVKSISTLSGHSSPDMDETNTHDWTGDDKATTTDEGIDQLLPNDLRENHEADQDGPDTSR